jgi:hypothetical protein
MLEMKDSTPRKKNLDTYGKDNTSKVCCAGNPKACF